MADQGNLYLFDVVGQRVVSFTKSNGKYVQEYVLPTGSPYFSALKKMFIRTDPKTDAMALFWIESGSS